MSRARCQRCLRPQTHCLCKHINPCEHHHSVIILQHPSEQKHAKGTAQLACLALNKAQIMVGETPLDFAMLKQQVLAHPERFYLIYPSSQSRAIEEVFSSIKTQEAPLNDPPCPPSLIFLDGTWRKAKRLWHLNPWLHNLDQFHFTSAPSGQYKIRKTSVDKGLSTIEAIGYSLEQIEMFDPTPLVGILRALANQQLSAMPEKVKHRY
ncbi:tRNA-uridine aminocarboxypropyltransferase [Agarivorans sp. DSG3-1]|uniref:tRNA-uridine aminocarboxypropyltransferase n=1 Tax=Agarivorans sp. DSG3-1 TaxID=3342249 RepID=UPI00398EA450